MNKKQIGNLGENMACNYLQTKNYKIIERNFNCKQGEIDIIAKDNKTKEIVFFEVKTRSGKRYGRGLDAINTYKLKHIINSAKYYLYINKITLNVRFDAIEIDLKLKKLNHVKQII